jgi:hypothetical protein
MTAPNLLNPPDAATADRLCRCYMLAVADKAEFEDAHELWLPENWQWRAAWVVGLRTLEHVSFDQMASFSNLSAASLRGVCEKHATRWKTLANELRVRAGKYLAADPAAGTGILETSPTTEQVEAVRA